MSREANHTPIGLFLIYALAAISMMGIFRLTVIGCLISPMRLDGRRCTSFRFRGRAGKYQISHDSGWIVRWDKKGDLFFLTTGNQLTKAELNLSAQSLQVKSLRRLFQINLADTPAPLFDVTADGQRLVAVTAARPESSSISLLLNWPALLHK